MNNNYNELNECYNIINRLETMQDEHLLANMLMTIINTHPEARESVINYTIFEV